MKSGSLNTLEPPGPHRPVTGLLYHYFYTYCTSNKDLPEERIQKKKWGWYCFLFVKKTPIKK